MTLPLFVTTDGTKWGAGTGTPLPAADVDNNFWGVHARLAALETTPPEAVGIDSISVDAGLMTITLTNGSIFGPYVLPTASFRFVNGWTNDLVLKANDFVAVDKWGIFLLLQDTTTPAAPEVFNPNILQGGLPVYKQIWGEPPVSEYPFALNYSGLIPGSNASLFTVPLAAAMRFLEDLPGAIFYLSAAPTAELVLTLYKNATVIGTVTFAADANFGVISFITDIDFAVNDVFSVIGPATEDATAANLGAWITAKAIA